jgi:hypothetical protein
MQAVAQRLERMQRDPKKIALKYARSLLSGILIGSFPYTLFLLHMLVTHVGLLHSQLDALTSVLAQTFFTLWPLVIIFQLVSALILIFTPRRRLIGAGILVAMILSMFAFVTVWPYFGLFF